MNSNLGIWLICGILLGFLIFVAWRVEVERDRDE